MSSLQESLPGQTARRWLARFFSPGVMESVFDPFLADLQADWLDAKSNQRANHARWCLLSAYVSLSVQVTICALGSLLGSNYELAPASGPAASVDSDSLSGRLARRVASLGVAFLVTFGLFMVMSSLIATQPDEMIVKPDITVSFLPMHRPSEPIDPVRPKLPDIPDSKPRPPVEGTPTGEQPSEKARLPLAPGGGWGHSFEIDFANPMAGAPVTSRSASPSLQVAPLYPQHALARGIEGWVEVEFTVTAVGSVSDPVVVNAHPSSIFNAVALNAVERWKYDPTVVEGEAVSRSGVRTRLVFEIDQR